MSGYAYEYCATTENGRVVVRCFETNGPYTCEVCRHRYMLTARLCAWSRNRARRAAA